LKATLPHQSRFIDANDPSAYHHLHEELKELLLTELKTMLEGQEADRAAIDKAKKITDAINKIETEHTVETAEVAKVKAQL